MKTGYLLLLLTPLLAGQTVTGEVYDSLSGKPVEGAYVSPVSPHRPHRIFSRTDGAGHFQLAIPAPAAPHLLTLDVERPGYVKASQTLRAEAGGSVAALRIPLTPAAVISGRLLDEDGYPAMGTLQALSYQVVNGERKLAEAQWTTPNDLGDYRLTGLAAGSYYIGVKFADGWDKRYLAQFVGGGLQPADAKPLEVKAGQELSGVDGRLKKFEGVSVAGRIPMPDKTLRWSPGEQPRAALIPPESFYFGSLLAPVHEDGTFLFQHVPPGSYDLRGPVASFPMNARDLPAGQPLEVGTAGVSGVLLARHEPQSLDVAGIVVLPGGGSPPPVAIEAHRRTTNLSARATSNPDGSFTLTGLMPGSYLLRVQPVAPAGGGAAPLSVSAAMGGEDVLERGFDLPATPPGLLRITLRPQMRIPISGKLLDAGGSPIPSAAVELIHEGVLPIQTKTGMDGSFQTVLETPGEYRVLVAGSSSSFADPKFIKAHREDSPPLWVVEGDSSPIVVRLPPR